ncbi:MAG TPA: helix-turn-helix domain-containing protein [Candidatus Nitrosopolaris sp.]|nr:helix-turn-helix domain-containing protein [Candidatus Nitrosopolaris sp.]
MASFVIGMASVIFYINLRTLHKKSINHIDGRVVEAVISEYTRKLQEFERIIGELKVKIDTVELRVPAHPTSQTSDSTSDMTRDSSVDVKTVSESKSQLEEHHSQTSDTMETTSITQPSNITSLKSNSALHHQTSDYILELLVEKSRNSREIQKAIGKTREHTSRLMRKLYESNLVSRDSNNKPFKYHITDQGRRELTFHTATGAVEAPDTNVHSGSQDSQLNVSVH